MPEHFKPTQPLSHAQILREEAGKRLSRSPHPYHRQQFELPYSSEQINSNVPQAPTPSLPTQLDDNEGRTDIRQSLAGYRDSNSDSGTEADDEHFLKGLPAPKSRPHKGLRNADGSVSNSPSPLLSPAILDDEIQNISGFIRKGPATSAAQNEEDASRAVKWLQRKRRVEIVRRVTEAGILVFVGGVLCLNREVRDVLGLWKAELSCQILIITSLIVVYPIRLLRHIRPHEPFKSPLPLSIPIAFDAAPLFYPPAITMLVSMILFTKTPDFILPNIILAISSLPRQLIPSVGGLQGSNTIQWLLSCLPLLISRNRLSLDTVSGAPTKAIVLNSESLVLLAPLHQATCVTLHYLTTTSLLTAELQLLSVALIDLLLLASSPQAVILKSLIWGGGVGLLASSGQVLKWGVALARVPKWRFRRGPADRGSRGMKLMSFGKFGTSLFAQNPFHSDSSEDEEVLAPVSRRRATPNLRLSTKSNTNPIIENGSASAIDAPSANRFPFSNGDVPDADRFLPVQRRHTLSTITSVPSKSSHRTPSGRRKRSSSSSVRSFFNLTQSQATLRKWLYAIYVYLCVLVIILIGIREYVQRFALRGNEPIGWALGYLFGDIPRFRMEVLTENLQMWICLPPRSGLENEESCHLGWVEHLRHASFGEANTRLILCGYWLAIIIVGLAIVFRLSSIYEVDTRRKVFHFMMVAMLLPATYVDPTFAALALSLMLAIFLLLDLFRASQLPPLSKSLAYFLTPYVDGRDLKGPVVISHIFLLIGCAIPLWLSLGTLPRTGTAYLSGWEVPTREVSMVSGVICVGMGDAAASLIGRRFGRRKWIWGGGKSIEGSIAFATAVGLALVLAKAWLRIGGWQANNDDSWVMTIEKSGIAACVASLTEAVLTGGNDNVVVPIVLWLCVKGLDI